MTQFRNHLPDPEQPRGAFELEKKLRGHECSARNIYHEDFYCIAVRSNPEIMHTMPTVYRQSKNVMLQAVKARGQDYRYTALSLRSDKELLRTAMQNGFPEGFGLAHDSFYDDDEMVREALELHPGNVMYVSRRLRDDLAFMLPVVEANPLLLRYMGYAVRDHEETIRMALSMNGMALEYASERLRDDKAIVSLALEGAGCAIRFATRRLRFDPVLVAQAVAQQEAVGGRIEEVLRFTSFTIQAKYGVDLS